MTETKTLKLQSHLIIQINVRNFVLLRISVNVLQRNCYFTDLPELLWSKVTIHINVKLYNNCCFTYICNIYVEWYRESFEYNKKTVNIKVCYFTLKWIIMLNCYLIACLIAYNLGCNLRKQKKNTVIFYFLHWNSLIVNLQVISVISEFSFLQCGQFGSLSVCLFWCSFHFRTFKQNNSSW